jgi:hypothetical protein
LISELGQGYGKAEEALEDGEDLTAIAPAGVAHAGPVVQLH